MKLFSEIWKKLFPEEQGKLDSHLFVAAEHGDANKVRELLAAGADVHAATDYALRWAASRGHRETVEILLAAGADVHALGDGALCWAATEGHTETVRTLAKHIFAADSWRGKSHAEIEEYACILYEKIKTQRPLNRINPLHLRKAAAVLFECATDCWLKVRPPPPQLKISSTPAQPKPL
jgi:ankyrin repeat protein